MKTFPLLNKRMVLLTLLLLSCNNRDKHIAPAKMEAVLTDITLAESYANMVAYDSASPYKPGMRNLDSLAYFHKEIFKHYNITAEDFKQSVGWYERHPEQMDSLVTHIAQKLADTGKKYGLEN